MRIEIYNIATIDENGKVEIIRRKYNSIYAYFTKELPNFSQLVSSHVNTNHFEYHREKAPDNTVSRYPKILPTIAVLKPTAIKDLDSIDAKYRDDRPRYDLCIDKNALIKKIKTQLDKGVEDIEINLGNGILYALHYQLKVNATKFIEDVADAHARYETSRGVSAQDLLKIAKEVQEILAQNTADLEIIENKHRYGTSHSVRIGELTWRLYGNSAEDLKHNHPMVKVTTFTDADAGAEY